MQGNGHLFSPGLPSTGSPVSFKVDAFGLLIDGVDIGAVAFQQMHWRRGGFNDSQLLLDWSDDRGEHSLAVSETGTQKLLMQHLQADRQHRRERVRGGRRLVSAIVGLFVGVPILLLVLLFAQADRVTQWAVERIPVETEKKLGAEAFSQYRVTTTLMDSHPALPMLRELGKRLTKGSPYTYEIHVVRNDTVNAFAMPGGYIVFHSALLQKADRAEEVAGVLAHEIQHVELRHGLRGLVHAAGWRFGLTLLLGDTGGSVAGALVENLGNLRFSRSQETDADLRGVQALMAADIDPRGMAEFFKKLAKEGGAVPVLLSSHPTSDDRFESVEKSIPAGRQFPALPYDIKTLLR